MRLSELMGKEIINIYDGARLGTIGDSDLLVDEKTGLIASIILPYRNRLLGWFKEKGHLEIPWSSVKRIGDEFIIVELERGYAREGSLL